MPYKCIFYHVDLQILVVNYVVRCLRQANK